MTCGRCHTDLTGKDVFAVREFPTETKPRKIHMTQFDEYGNIVHDWKIKTVCKECLIEITGGI